MFCVPNLSSAQSWCGTPDVVNAVQIPLNYQKRINNAPVCLNIKFHIVRQSDETGGFNPSNIPNILNRLNGDYNAHNIFFNSVGFDYINDDVYYDLSGTEDQDLLLLNHSTTAFNFYIVNAAPYRGVSMSPTEFIVKAVDAESSISSHEIGHCFSLYHTHRGMGTGGNNQEKIPRGGLNSNCNTAGDLLCDTPADPYLLAPANSPYEYKVDSNCNYFFNEMYQGYMYDPDTHNIMSYSRPECMDNFSQGQVNRMHYFIDSTSVLQNILSTSCIVPEIVGEEFICGSTPNTYLLNSSTSVSNWFVTSNLNIVSQNSSSVTVTALPNEIGTGTITANVNGAIITHNVMLTKKPLLTQHIIQGGADNVTFNSFDGFTVQQPPQLGLTYQWTLVTTNLDCSNGGSLPSITGASGNPFTSGSYITINHGSCSGTYRLRCKVINECGVDNYLDKEINVYNPDISDPCASKISLYPNPSKAGNVTLKMHYPDLPCDNNKMASTPYTVGVHDIYGVLLFQEKSASEKLTLKTEKLKSGLYFIHLVDARGNEQKRSLIIK
ncbi:T9SS type A sorting domain-containing protein [Bizionia sp. M204]|uniref:T9SS type A sorting domain-containing protein n=1 Tax=Bizionia sp. M204 TaxID=2675331 RepID=UPI00206FE609|nr:T9SS type A sorting domain-containing protein [Bizionia sp. M204]UPS91803.1 T9SS type A sorting domain-containing protein [Bizionia sp. M204]